MINPDITYDQVYYVKSNQIRNPVAIRPHLRNDVFEWEDTSRGTSVEVAKIKFTPSPEKSPDQIDLITFRGEEITLQKLTLELYNKEVREYVAGKLVFASDEELQQYYLTTNFQVY